VGGSAESEQQTERRRAWSLLVWLGIVPTIAAMLLASPLATAQGGRWTDSRMLDAIRAQMQKGEALFVAAKYQEAAQVFEDGYRQHPYPAFLFNAGVAYQKLGDVPKALERFRSYVAADP
jgi:tetratricopeptide (TPR) repeat protein